MNQGLISEQIVIEEVKNAIVETLGIEASTIEADSSLMRDLGAESLDFLDINYRLEQAFGIKMARHSLLEHIEEVFKDIPAEKKPNKHRMVCDFIAGMTDRFAMETYERLFLPQQWMIV